MSNAKKQAKVIETPVASSKRGQNRVSSDRSRLALKLGFARNARKNG